MKERANMKKYTSRLLLLITLIVGIYFWLFSSGEMIFLLLDKDDPRSVQNAFVLAMMTRRLDMAKSLVIPEQEQRVEDWIIDHEKAFCPVKFNRYGSGVGGQTGEKNYHMFSWSYRFSCLPNSHFQCLLVINLALEYSNEGWLVTDWADIGEGIDRNYC